MKLLFTLLHKEIVSIAQRRSVLLNVFKLCSRLHCEEGTSYLSHSVTSIISTHDQQVCFVSKKAFVVLVSVLFRFYIFCYTSRMCIVSAI